jgi:hypothetical protein
VLFDPEALVAGRRVGGGVAGPAGGGAFADPGGALDKLRKSGKGRDVGDRYPSGASLNRADAMVWALTEPMLRGEKAARVRGL